MGIFDIFGSKKNDRKSADAVEISLIKGLVKEVSELESMLNSIKQYVERESTISKTFTNWTAALDAHKVSFKNISSTIHKNNINHIQAIEDIISALNVLFKTIHDLELKFLSVKTKIPLTKEDKAMLKQQILFVEGKIDIVNKLDAKDLILLDEDMRRAA